MGNAIDPAKKLEGQSDIEYETMKFLFLAETTVFSADCL